jgi:hypothetical protein
MPPKMPKYHQKEKDVTLKQFWIMLCYVFKDISIVSLDKRVRRLMEKPTEN